MKMLFWAKTGLCATLLWAGSSGATLAAPAPENTNAPAAPASEAADGDKDEEKAARSPEAGVARQNYINVRGQARINSEVLTRLNKGQDVTVLDEVTMKTPQQDEPARWYKISLPTNSPVWVHSLFIDATNKTVIPRRLNLRGGPGENYSIVGRIERGTAVTEVGSKDQWLKIETPTSAYGFVAAHLIELSAPHIATTTPTPASATNATAAPAVTQVPTNTTLAVAQPPAAPAQAPATPPAVPPPATLEAVTPPPATTPTTVAAPAPNVPAIPVPDDKRVVSREGLLRGSVSIQAPTYYELRSLDTGKTINYVFSPSTNITLKDFRSQRIIVSGEELLDERWPHTPVITVDRLQTVP